MKKIFIAAIAALTAITACQKNEVAAPAADSVLYATIEGTDATKTYMDASNNIRWSEGDQVIAFMKTSLGLRYQVTSSSVGKASARFEEVGNNGGGLNAGTEWDHNIAYYPYSEIVECLKSGNNYALNVVLPSEQTYAPESFGNGSMAMVAVSEDNNITFRNILGGMKLQLRGTQKVVSIKLEGKNSEILSGAATVTAYTDETKPAITMASNASISVTLRCDPAVQLNENTATEFIIALPPTVFTKGFTVTVTDYDGKTYKVDTDKKNEIIRSSLLVMPEVTLEDSVQDDRWVDLGLSVLWAAYNVGASSPEEYGGYYAWGETSTKSDYTWENYIYCEKYYDGDWYWVGKFIGNEISGTSYDVAHVQWGGGARMPTLAEVEELVDNCTFTGGSYNGVEGSYVTGPNGNSIFLPFAGGRNDDGLYVEGRYGLFWSGTYVDGPSGTYAYNLNCYKGRGYWGYCYRYYGHSVRPVTEK